jgi:hypothetical protein
MLRTISCAIDSIDSIDSFDSKRGRDLGELGDLGGQIGERVDVAEAGSLEQAAGVDVVLAHQICDGAGDLDQPVDAAGCDGAAALDQLGEGALAECVELAGGAQDGGSRN